MTAPRLSLHEAAEFLELKGFEVLELVADGKLEAIHEGHRVLFDPEELQRCKLTLTDGPSKRRH